MNGFNMATIRDQRKSTEWRNRMTRFGQSGLSIAKFCHSENVPVHQFYYWAKRCAAAPKVSTTTKEMVEKADSDSTNPVEMSCLDVDTRSDVYSLGVLLYELLTGTTPLEGERLRTAGYAEMQRLIREDEPPKPSTRLSTSGEKLTVIAKHRAVSPETLKHQVQGDLDWIVMKALEKQRTRRYDSASRLYEEIQKYLANDMVEARPPSTWYQLKKFYQRNRTFSRAALIVVGLVVASFIIVTGLLFQLNASRAELVDRTNELTSKNEELSHKQGKLDAANENTTESVMREGILAALAGDLERANNAILFLERNEETSGDALLLSATIKLNQGEFTVAVKDAEESKAL